jgi:predicted PurR-regulated permease PerM/methylmalonyl-CoA mutase cobalamin-binding subunit
MTQDEPEQEPRSALVRPAAPPRFVDQRVQERRQTTARIFVGSILVVAVLYVARQVFIPIALAILFAFLLRPIVSLLERSFLRRVGAIVLALSVAVSVLGVGTYWLTLQMNSLAAEVAAYTGNLQKKLRHLNLRSGRTMALVERTLEEVTAAAQPPERADLKVRVIPERKTLEDRYKDFAPTAEYVAAGFLVVFLVFFMLKDREQIRDRLLRLAGRANLTVTTQAIGETTFRISRYLLTWSAINASYGLVVGLGLWLLNVPHAILWGVLAGLLRFIPYVGAVIGAALPTILALAFFEDWYVPIAVLLLFIVADQILGGFIEPLVVGHRVGVSPIAILLAAIFWSWLWGPVGLLLATPITVCLTVAGEFIPALRAFSIMFGSEAPLEGYLSFYNRLLTRDRSGAIAIADRYAEEHSMEATYNDLFVPTLSFSAEELERNRITRVHDHFIKDVTRELIIRLGDRNAEVSDTSPRVVAVPMTGERLSLGTLMLTQLLREQGYGVDYLTDLTPHEVESYVRDIRPEAIFASCSKAEHLEQGLQLLTLLSRTPDEPLIVAGGSAFAEDEARTLSAGAHYVPKALVESKESLLRDLKKRGRRRATA